jgi:hypothetical protein
MEFNELDNASAMIRPTTTKGSTFMVSAKSVRAMEPKPQLRMLSKVFGSISVKKVVTPPKTAANATPASTKVTGLAVPPDAPMR